MSKDQEQTQNVDVETLRKQIEEELRAEYEAKSQEEAEKAEKERKKLEDKLAKQEKSMEAQITKQEKSLREQLESFPKVMIEIPEDQNNPDDVVPVGWNGIIYAIPRGIQFEVPKPIYDIWRESHKLTQEANKRIRESVNKEIEIY